VTDDDATPETDPTLDISRRKTLTALGTIGAAGAGAGYGTSAFFSDSETFGNSSLVAGELDMTAAYSAHYSDWSADEAEGVSVRMWDGPAGTTGGPGDLENGETGLPTNDTWLVAVDDPEQFLANTQYMADGDASCGGGADADQFEQPVIDLEDVKPGDFGQITFDFALCDNPGFVWLNGEIISASENGQSEPEAEDDHEGSGVELLDVIQAAVWVDDGDNYQDGDEEPLIVDSLRTVLNQLPSSGRPTEAASGPAARALEGDIPAEEGGGSGRNCFSPETTHSVAVAWYVPVDHGNEIQTDTVSFGFWLYAEQCRHNSGQTRTTTDDIFDTEPFVTQSGSGSVTVSASQQAADTTAIADIPQSTLAGDAGVSLSSLEIDFDAPAALDLTVSGDAALGGEEPVPDGFDAIGGFTVEHSTPADEAIRSVRFGLTVDRDRLEQPARFTVLRQTDTRGWTALKTELVNRTSTTYQFRVVSPGLSVFALATTTGVSARLRLPEGDARPDPEVVASFTGVDTVRLDGQNVTTGGDRGPVVDLTGVGSDYPTEVPDAFEVTNLGDRTTTFSLSVSSEEIDLLFDPSGAVSPVGTSDAIPTLDPGESVTVGVRVRPNDPDDQLWVTLGVPTLFDREEDRAVLVSSDGRLPGQGPDGPRGGCVNNAIAPMLVPEDTYFPGLVNGTPEWLPNAADTSKVHHRVPAVLNVRKRGEIDDTVFVTIPTTDGHVSLNEDQPDGRLVAVTNRERPGDEANEALSSLGFRFDPEELNQEAQRRKADLIFVSNLVCGDDEFSTSGTAYDNIGELSVEVEFLNEGSRWEQLAGQSTVTSGLRYYTPGQALTEQALTAAERALEIFANETVGHIMPGGPVRTYRVVRAFRGSRPLAGPATELLGLYEAIDSRTEQPLTPSSILAEKVFSGLLSGIQADVSLGSDAADFFPALDDARIEMSGPSVYISDETDPEPITGEIRTTTTDDADAEVLTDDLSGDGELRFRVFKCNTARAEIDLGNLDTVLSVSFDYESRRTGEFWEIPFARVFVDDEVAFDATAGDQTLAPNLNRGIDGDSDSVPPRTGQVDQSIEVNGAVRVEFGVEPSPFCANFDHEDTLLRISNLRIEGE
jgi:hypothetical protein